MEKISEETAKKIQELQLLEQNLQSLLLQKQAFQLELSEIENASEEIKKSKEDVYKIVGPLMLKAKKQEIETELKNRKEIMDMRMKAIDKQEQIAKDRALKKREEVMKELK